ncbi:hypothetical protein [Megasphaera sueciensis]|uniref:hypothetical protein n=1 Tax=Megasphaera sueciensis TaxID=349094 RepID=UPI003D05FDB8
MSDDTMIKECAKVGLSRGCGIEPPEWVNAPKKPAEQDIKKQENPVPVIKMELYFEVSDDLKNARQDRNMFIVINMLLLAACVYMSWLLGVW